MTLVILAAGMGSRYGGLKQIDPISSGGSFIIDFSVYDAIKAGFDKVVFVIKKENFDVFKETIGKRFENKINVEYAFQTLDDLPSGYSVPSERTKPWGTSHAMLSAKNLVNEPFAVINADDFYGRDAFLKLSDHLRSEVARSYCMIGYELSHTITENGSVSRGVCTTSNDSILESIVERTKIFKDQTIYYELDGKKYSLDPTTTVSMNCWGFTPDVFDLVATGFERFLKDHSEDLKSEYYLPSSIQELISENLCTVKVYKTTGDWYGVTYKEDKDHVKKGINSLIAGGVYPADM